ncbi:MAG: hypothetical protein R3E31_10065 [Chloroflexota bacterium]
MPYYKASTILDSVSYRYTNQVMGLPPVVEIIRCHGVLPLPPAPKPNSISGCPRDDDLRLAHARATNGAALLAREIRAYIAPPAPTRLARLAAARRHHSGTNDGRPAQVLSLSAARWLGSTARAHCGQQP